MPQAKTYEQVHAGLFWFYGKATGYRCVGCGETARDWAYQYSAGINELRSPSGSRYSENFADYSAMCQKCHKRFDLKSDPEMHEVIKAAGRKGGQRPGNVDQCRAAGKMAAIALKTRLDADPLFREQFAETCRVREAAAKRQCVCGLISTPMGIGRHQKSSGHVGYVDLNIVNS